MLIHSIVKEKNEVVSLLIHVGLGIGSLFSIYVAPIWFYLVMLSGIAGIIIPRTRSRTVLLLSGYVMGVELQGRMLQADPFLPYQLGSYFMLVVYTTLIFDHYKTAKTHIGFVLFLLCLPGLFMIQSDFQNRFVGVFSGIFSMALGSIYFSRQRYTREDLMYFMKGAVLPVVTMLTYLFFKTIPVSEIEFTLTSSFKTSGGFGPNQISTILGAAACFIILPSLIGGQLFRTFKFINYALLALLLYRGLLTFSRGGMLGCLLAVLLAYLYLASTDVKKLGSFLLRLGVFVLLGYAVFQYSDALTGGKLSLRYKGETGGTLEGTKEKDMRAMTTGRSDIIAAEWQIFMEHFWVGVGPGNGYNARGAIYGKNVTSHTEASRLISEQGLPGLLIVIIFLFYPFYRIHKSHTKEERYYLIAIFTLAIFTSFHSGMRTILTPVLWGLGCADFRFFTIPAVKTQSVSLTAPSKQLKQSRVV